MKRRKSRKSGYGRTALTLSVDDVLKIHNVLVSDFAKSNDPISPAGVRSGIGLLESAVNRQSSGFGEELKYRKPIDNAATLCYGICCNHPFHNGNKRTALVAMLCHLDKNNFKLCDNVSQDDLYKFMLHIAAHYFKPDKSFKHRKDFSDQEIQGISRWLVNKTKTINKSEKIITYRQLRQILHQHGITMDNPKNNSIDIVKYEQKRSIFGRKNTVRNRITHITYPGESREIGKSLIRKIREDCELTEKYGYDSDQFYSGEREIDFFIQKYRRTLKKLARV